MLKNMTGTSNKQNLYFGNVGKQKLYFGNVGSEHDRAWIHKSLDYTFDAKSYVL